MVTINAVVIIFITIWKKTITIQEKCLPTSGETSELQRITDNYIPIQKLFYSPLLNPYKLFANLNIFGIICICALFSWNFAWNSLEYMSKFAVEELES